MASNTVETPPTRVVVVTDPDVATGNLLVQEAIKRGYNVMLIWTQPTTSTDATFFRNRYAPQSSNGGKVQQVQAIPTPNSSPSPPTDDYDVPATAQLCIEQLGSSGGTVVACLAGSSCGVALANGLSRHWKTRCTTNDTPPTSSPSYRKLRQMSGTQRQDFVTFLNEKDASYPLLIQPVAAAPGEAQVCNDTKSALALIDSLLQKTDKNNSSILCQAVVPRGSQEYVIDHVSRNGRHVSLLVWSQTYRAANGSRRVPWGRSAVTDPVLHDKLVTFVRKVLTEEGIVNGPSFAHVVVDDTEDGAKDPLLVSLETSVHGGRWRPLTKTMTGYSLVDVVMDCYLEDEATFALVPDSPTLPYLATAEEIRLVSFVRGIVESTPGFSVLQKLPSFVALETSVEPGSAVEYTVDSTTSVGTVLLLHHDASVVERDAAFIRTLQEIHGLFNLETKLANLKRPHGEHVILPPPSTTDDDSTGHRRVFSSDGPSLIRHMSTASSSVTPLQKRVTTVDASQEMVILVDPYSTGCCIAHEILKRGYGLIALWTTGFSPAMKEHVPLSVLGKITYAATVDEAPTMAETVQRLYKAAGTKRLVACLAGGEAGVDFADALAERLQVRGNGTRIPNKRDKKIQQELIQARGLRSVRQAGGSTWEEVREFVETETYPLVLKPVESAGSDGVKLCHSFKEAKEHFEVLMDSQMVNGGQCPAVLCQEFLRGKEYVVDHVSRDGVHKTVMVWVYDKRPVNGSAFVYFGCVPVDSNSPEAKLLIPYVRKVLDSLDFSNGPSHGEVMMTPNGPCLVEMNCRSHGGDGNWRPLCQALCGGYSQVELAVDSFLDSRQFGLAPEKPPSPFKASGQEVILVSFSRGTVKATPGYDEIQQLESFVYLETGVKPGSVVDYTIDLFTGIGSVILMHEDEAILQKDVQRIREMEQKDLLFEYEGSSSAAVLQKAASSSALNTIVSTSERPELY